MGCAICSTRNPATTSTGMDAFSNCTTAYSVGGNTGDVAGERDEVEEKVEDTRTSASSSPTANDQPAEAGP